MDNVKEELRQYILSGFLPGEKPSNLRDDTPLRTSGILDSVATLRLVSFVEEHYGRGRMVKRRGNRIELGEVESCLYRHPSITEAAAISTPHPQSGMRIVAYLVAPPDAQPSIVEMKGFCNQHLPAYMNPDIFVFAGALPRTSTKKVDYQALIRKFQAAEQGGGAAGAPAREHRL
jgi:acyl-CoA synthetase (AMP-forming)/AMP-acid ligase II